MAKHTFFSIDKTAKAERFVNIQQTVKIDVFKNGSVRLWLTNGEEVTVTGPEAISIIDLLGPSIAGLTAMEEQLTTPVRNRDFCYR